MTSDQSEALDDTGLEKWMYKPILKLMEWVGEKSKEREIEEMNERIHGK